ncbi:3-oxoacyl-[acyl-carrier-protein] synthase 2 [Streptomyces sp. S4.7]|uniref:beta-ketoacyl synthase N-terminal-like domain-containing protein n=1 Tax=Streptomyces sp. S4.7 TaxID=2705439 RepID=UPI001396ED26|nr:beta-ketoacyl synthase N-terminal-like domain-containing protein [Streptomyces sp. S4.7]QHY93674.1 3-oxoacyl-[acyl-carrier-protein] synthase 2 [Streptomyces sp. S4.7]
MNGTEAPGGSQASPGAPEVPAASAAPVRTPPDGTVVTGVGLAVPGLRSVRDLLTDRPPADGFDPATALKGREMRNKDRASRLALYAAEQALGDAGLLDEKGHFRGATANATAVVASSNLGSLQTVCDFTDTIARDSVTGLSPLGLPQTSSNVVAGWVAIRYGLRGPNLTVCNGATSGLDALHWARNLIGAGRCRRAVVVGVEPATEHAGRLLGRTAPDVACAVVLESVAEASARQAEVYAHLSAYTRGAELAPTVALTESGAPAPVGLRLTGGLAQPPAAPAGQSLDLTARLGECSGALGVLQGAVGAMHIRTHGTRAVLAFTGGADADDAAAALLLTGEYNE